MHRKIVEKRFPTRFLSESRDRSVAKSAFCEFGRLKRASESSPERLGRPPEAHLGALGELLGCSWGALGRSWGALGAFLGARDGKLSGGFFAV